jgi:hypothetical protein
VAEPVLEHERGQPERRRDHERAHREQVQRRDQGAQEQREQHEVDQQGGQRDRAEAVERPVHGLERQRRVPGEFRRDARQPGLHHERRHACLEVLDVVEPARPERVAVQDHDQSGRRSVLRREHVPGDPVRKRSAADHPRYAGLAVDKDGELRDLFLLRRHVLPHEEDLRGRGDAGGEPLAGFGRRDGRLGAVRQLVRKADAEPGAAEEARGEQQPGQHDERHHHGDRLAGDRADYAAAPAPA